MAVFVQVILVRVRDFLSAIRSCLDLPILSGLNCVTSVGLLPATEGCFPAFSPSLLLFSFPRLRLPRSALLTAPSMYRLALCPPVGSSGTDCCSSFVLGCSFKSVPALKLLGSRPSFLVPASLPAALYPTPTSVPVSTISSRPLSLPVSFLLFSIIPLLTPPLPHICFISFSCWSILESLIVSLILSTSLGVYLLGLFAPW